MNGKAASKNGGEISNTADVGIAVNIFATANESPSTLNERQTYYMENGVKKTVEKFPELLQANRVSCIMQYHFL